MARPAFLRKDLKKDVIYNFIRIRDVYISVSKKRMAANRVRDDLVLEMEKEGLISSGERQGYEEALLAAFSRIERYDEAAPWEIYGEVSRLRLTSFGEERLESMAALQARRGVDFAPAIDQSHIKDRLIREAATVTVVLSEPALRAQMEADLAKAEGKRICTFESMPEAPEGPVLYYGESGLLECGGLSVPAVVTAIPRGYCAQAVTGLWNGEGCVVYIPAGFDIAPHVPMTSKTRLTYSHLALLEKRCGEEIYGLSVAELYRRWPRVFVNVYGLAESCLPVAPGADSLTAFDRRLEEDLGAFLGSFPGAAYTAAYFDEELQRRPICYDAATTQKGILVHGIRVKKAAGAKVLQCEKGQTPRTMFRQLGLPGTALVSNFLFFMTPKLGVLYNDLRADRPLEQADAASGHLDYMLSYRDGKRTETFPLFGKTCIGMRENGEFLFFNFFLGGGCVDISGIRYRWEKADVNSERALRVYTPMYSAADRDADRDTYRKAVGEGRVNVVLLREKVTCIRRGEVLLPSVGVVLSLTEELAAPLLAKCAPLENGYYDVSGLELTVRLDAPEGVKDWESVRWAFGGGLTLIRNGEGLCDGEHMERWFDAEGWTSPLSRQTQESNLHSLVRHPRTAIGCAENGDLLVLVFSGRTWRSVGADYSEMICIARQLYPDVHYLMNGDGGGSAMLGLVHRGEFLELSCPSTSFGSCAGQVRPINTVFYIPVDGNE